MADSNFGIMDLLQKLFKERGTGVSKKEQGILGQYEGTPIRSGEGSGYQSFIDKSKMKAGDNYKAGQMQYIDPLANTTQYNNATTGALNTMKGYVPDSGTTMRDLKTTFGNQFTEREANKLLDLPDSSPNLSTSQQEYMRFLKEQGGAQFTEREAMNQVSNVDTMFAQALGALTPAEQSEIISATRGYNDAQVENFKIQYLQGRISPYELEAQSNLGF